MDAERPPLSMAVIAEDLMLSNEMDGLWYGYGPVVVPEINDTPIPEAQYIPIEQYGPTGEVEARYRAYVIFTPDTDDLFKVVKEDI